MLPSSDGPTTSGPPRQLRRWGPVVAIVVVVAVIAAVVAASSGGSKKAAAVRSAGAGTVAGGPGAVSFQQAKAQHVKDTFPKGCDPKTGHVAVPISGAPPCYANVAANGGATSDGVTATSIKVVLYLGEPNDPILDYVEGAIKDTDTNAQTIATYQTYDRLFQSYYQTYGRTVDLIPVVGSGNAADEVSARADAAKVAAMHPFAVWGGPALTDAWADELAADHIPCISCTGASAPSWYAQRAPYVYTLTLNADQSDRILADYLGSKLVGKPASHAGDPAFTKETRKFGLLYIDSTPDSQTYADEEATLLKTQYHTDLVEVAYTLDPASLQEQASSDIAKLKAAGVTTVVFSGDPVAPGTFTRQATSQDYFPEWVIGASALVDQAVFARTYDQKQWAHAFGISFLGARVPRETAGSYFLYQWFTGSPPPAADGNGVILPQPEIFFYALQAAGPDLTPQTFQQGMFTIDTPTTSLTNPGFAYGNHGLWSYPSYNGLDDATEIWWNPTATGPDEVGHDGTGLYEFVDGGKHYTVGQWPTTPDTAFDPAGAVTIYPSPPAADAVPNYPSPAGG